MIFSEQLRARMSELGLTQMQLAELVGMSQPGIGNYLRGNIPTADRLLVLAGALGVSMEELLTGRKSGAPPPSHRAMEDVFSSKSDRLRRELKKVEMALDGLRSALDAADGSTDKHQVNYKK